MVSICPCQDCEMSKVTMVYVACIVECWSGPSFSFSGLTYIDTNTLHIPPGKHMAQLPCLGLWHLLGVAPSTFTTVYLCVLILTSQICPSCWSASATCHPKKPSCGLTMLSMEITAPLNTVRINTMSAAVRAKPRAALSICEQRTTSHANLRGLINQSFHSGVLVEGPPITFYQMFSRMKVSCFMVPQTHPPALHSKWF